MKKNQFFSFLTLLLVSIIICSCNKNEDVASKEPFSDTENDDLKRNEATWISLGPEKDMGFVFRLFVGHTKTDCGNSCVEFFGQSGHIDCRGFGNVCNHNATAYYSVGQDPGDLKLTLIEVDVFGSDLEYPLPDRSFYITNPQNNTELWLNIPEQILERTDTEEPFVIYNIWFSEEQELINR